MELSLAGKVALVTGGSRGIGAATVEMLARAGAHVHFGYQREREAAERLIAACGRDKTAASACDLADPDGPRTLVVEAVERFGRLDILVANHGVWPPHDAPIDRMSEAQWRRTLAINLDAVFGLVKHAVAQMKRQPRPDGVGGNIVLVSSTAAQRGEAFHCDYAASKGALISMVKGLSTELAPDGIRVNCVAPGWVDTEMAAPALTDERVRPTVLAKIPLGRVATPAEIAAPIVFLCTQHAGFITGEVLNVNGGAVLAG